MGIKHPHAVFIQVASHGVGLLKVILHSKVLQGWVGDYVVQGEPAMETIDLNLPLILQGLEPASHGGNSRSQDMQDFVMYMVSGKLPRKSLDGAQYVLVPRAGPFRGVLPGR